MKRVLTYTLIFSTVLLTACKIFKKDNTQLPNKPKQIEIIWEQNRGMIGGYESIYLSNDSCAHKLRQKGQEQVVNFTIPQTDLLHLYETFVSNKFPLIESEKRDVYDRGGTKITLTVDGKSKTVNNSGMYFVKDSYLQNFNNIEKEINLVAFKEINKLKKDVIIDLSDELKNSPYYLFLYVNDEEVYNELNDGNFSTLTKKLFEQNNTFKVTLMEKGSTYNTIKGNYEVTVKRLPESAKITLTLVDNNLTIK
jgi:hypothetical protein